VLRVLALLARPLPDLLARRRVADARLGAGPHVYCRGRAARNAAPAGKLAPDTRLPSEAELAEQYGVARVSVRRAIEQLRERGKVVTFQGRGRYVTPR